MARIDDLISQVTDGPLRAQLADAAVELRRRKKFGLVFEQHVPETVLVGATTHVQVGAEVMLRREPGDKARYAVTKVTKHQATISDGESTRTLKKEDLLVIVPFGDTGVPGPQDISASRVARPSSTLPSVSTFSEADRTADSLN